jgi:hypothetical protein
MTHNYSPKTAPVYQFKVTLEGITPVIWRRFLVSSNITLDKLHDTIQIIMGWTNSHLHMFEVNWQVYGDPEDDEYGDLGTLDEASYRLRKVLTVEGSRIRYEYDFGDSWWHTLRLEKILPPDPRRYLPVCLEGKRACPPEDVGGSRGYEDFLDALGDPQNEEHDEYLMWVGGKFDPNAFDLESVNRQLRRIKVAPAAWEEDEYPPSPDEKQNQTPKVPTFSKEQRQTTEALPLRRDVLSFIHYLQVNRVIGTQATGNLPLKAVRAICSQFVHPPQLETWIGERVYPVRSESEVRPLYFVHVLVSVGGLITGGPGRPWRVGSLGEKFMMVPAEVQVWLLFLTWWTQVNWAIVWPIALEEFPSAHTRKIIHEHLLGLPENRPLPFKSFADQVIEAASLSWPHGDGDPDRTILHGLIEATVARPLGKFGLLDLTYMRDAILGMEFQELSALSFTELGKTLLENMLE